MRCLWLWGPIQIQQFRNKYTSVGEHLAKFALRRNWYCWASSQAPDIAFGFSDTDFPYNTDGDLWALTSILGHMYVHGRNSYFRASGQNSDIATTVQIQRLWFPKRAIIWHTENLPHFFFRIFDLMTSLTIVLQLHFYIRTFHLGVILPVTFYILHGYILYCFWLPWIS